MDNIEVMTEAQKTALEALKESISTDVNDAAKRETGTGVCTLVLYPQDVVV